MNQAHVRAILEGVVPELKAAIVAAQKPLIDRLDALEKRAPEKGEPGERGLDGKDGAPGESIKGDKGDPGEPGESIKGDPGEAGPSGADGRDGVDGKDGLEGPPGKDGAAGRDGEPGRDGVDGKDGAPGNDGAKGDVGDRGERGEPGDRGEKGDPGRDGRDASDLTVIREVAAEQAREFVKNFATSLTWTSDDGGRTHKLSWAIGDLTGAQELVTAIPLYKGVWKEGPHKRGDCVSLGGHLWIAKEDTEQKPEFAEGCPWQLSVKKGRDGKDFRPDGPPVKTEVVRLK